MRPLYFNTGDIDVIQRWAVSRAFVDDNQQLRSIEASPSSGSIRPLNFHFERGAYFAHLSSRGFCDSLEPDGPGPIAAAPYAQIDIKNLCYAHRLRGIASADGLRYNGTSRNQGFWLVISYPHPPDKGISGANIRSKNALYCDLLKMRNGFTKPQRQIYDSAPHPFWRRTRTTNCC